MKLRKIVGYILYFTAVGAGALALYLALPRLSLAECCLFSVALLGCLYCEALQLPIVLKDQSRRTRNIVALVYGVCYCLLVYCLLLLVTPLAGITTARRLGVAGAAIACVFIMIDFVFSYANPAIARRLKLTGFMEWYSTLKIWLFPDHAVHHYTTRAYAYLQQNKLSEAMHDYERAAHHAITLLLDEQGGVFAWSLPFRGRTLQTEEIAISRIASLYEHKPSVKTHVLRQLLHMRGFQYYLPHHAQDAAYLAELTLRVPVSADHQFTTLVKETELYLGYAKWLFELKRYDEVQAMFQHVLSIEPDSLDAALGTAITQYAAGEHAAAYTAWRTLSQREPDILNANWVTTNFYVESPFALADMAQHIIATLEQQTA
jgi:tetratricopeptide (TPR) repeat protein